MNKEDGGPEGKQKGASKLDLQGFFAFVVTVVNINCDTKPKKKFFF